MPRDRSRGRVARPDDTAPAEDGADGADDDDDPTPDLSERDGTIDDLLDDQVGNVEQQVLSGSQANLRIAPEVNPGFVETEVVNRMGLVLSLNLEFDPSRQQWVPAVVDKTERQAVEQALVEDQATDDLTGPVDPGDTAEIDQNGDLRITEDPQNESNLTDGAGSEYSTTNKTGVRIRPTKAVSEVTGAVANTGTQPTRVQLYDNEQDEFLGTGSVSDGRFSASASIPQGADIIVWVDRNGDSYRAVDYDDPGFPIETAAGDVVAGMASSTDSNPGPVTITDIGQAEVAEQGTATTSFDNPCTATSTRSAQHDVCSKSSDVTVDLYNGDPAASDSTLLARNIDQREDISDLPDAFTDLQYKLTLRRDENGESPKVSRLGHQLIR